MIRKISMSNNIKYSSSLSAKKDQARITMKQTNKTKEHHPKKDRKLTMNRKTKTIKMLLIRRKSSKLSNYSKKNLVRSST